MRGVSSGHMMASSAGRGCAAAQDGYLRGCPAPFYHNALALDLLSGKRGAGVLFCGRPAHF